MRIGRVMDIFIPISMLHVGIVYHQLQYHDNKYSCYKFQIFSCASRQLKSKVVRSFQNGQNQSATIFGMLLKIARAVLRSSRYGAIVK
jgi:hypothetical protein